MIEEGRSIHSIRMEYGINEDRLHVLWERYQLEGQAGLLKKKNIKADFSLKKEIELTPKSWTGIHCHPEWSIVISSVVEKPRISPRWSR